MFKIQTLILFALISFSLQDSNCLVYYERCVGKEQSLKVKIDNCKEGYLNLDGEEECYECNSGYAIRVIDYKSCKKIENEIENCLDYYINENEELCCYKCPTDYVTSHDDKRCVKFPNCDSLNNNDKCQRCKTGYAASYDGTSCKQFENCLKLAQGDGKCGECNDYFHPNTEGKCERTQCSKYDDTNNVCTECYGGYYLNDDKKCEKITIENCLEVDSKNEKCVRCVFGINPDSDGKCTTPLIKGCSSYENNGKCRQCNNDDYELTNEGTCKFLDCKDGEYKKESCLECKAGYYSEWDDDKDNYICIGYDGSMDTSSDSSSRNKVEYALLIFILALLI